VRDIEDISATVVDIKVLLATKTTQNGKEALKIKIIN
tara:strand:- start:700 stop:810 length:111 start_codon:yes stop_codon:yes gene_type:complete